MTRSWRMPAETDPHERTWMAFPRPNTTFGGGAEASVAWAAVANAIAAFEPVRMLVDPVAAATASRLLDGAIERVETPLDDAWLRDSGPTFVLDDTGRLGAVDWIFNGWGAHEWAEWGRDRLVGGTVAAAAGADLLPSLLVNEGGGIHVDGEGTVLVTETVQLDPRRNPWADRARVEAELTCTIGSTCAVWLPRGLTRDYGRYGTSGHVDICATIPSPGQVLLHEQRDPGHPDFAVSALLRSSLEQAVDAAGRSFEIVALPAPDTLRDAEGFVDWSYVNHVVVNGAVVACARGRRSAGGAHGGVSGAGGGLRRRAPHLRVRRRDPLHHPAAARRVLPARRHAGDTGIRASSGLTRSPHWGTMSRCLPSPSAAPVAERDPGPGDVLAGRYEIQAELGRGGMATVFRGLDRRLQRLVAVKVFRGGFAEAVDPQRTTQEMRLLAAVNHPAVVSVLDASNGDGVFGAFLVMELVQGDDLGALLHRARGPLSADLARRIVADVAGALGALHAQGVVHRDVKPANILVPAAATSGVAAKLTDFGIAQLVDGARLTGPDSVLGTAAYLSPEQVRGAAPRPASDVYSLGLVLLEALTGKRAFPGPAAESAIARLQRPPALPEDASPALADLLSRMTALDPAGRPAARDVAAALREQLVGRVTAPDAAQTAPTPVAGLAVMAPSRPDATAPQEAVLRASRSMPLSGPIPTAGRPRRFPAALAVAATALAAAVAGVAISAAANLSDPSATANAAAPAPPSSSTESGGQQRTTDTAVPAVPPVVFRPASPSPHPTTPAPTASAAPTATTPVATTAPPRTSAPATTTPVPATSSAPVSAPPTSEAPTTPPADRPTAPVPDVEVTTP